MKLHSSCVHSLRRGALLQKLLALFPLVTLGLYALCARSAGTWGWIDVKATQVAVRVNYLTGVSSVVQRPGYQVFMPYFEDVFLLDKSPVEFQMAGDVRRGHNEVPFLLVRSKDGSNFWFESLEIQYQLQPEAAGLVLNESGPSDGFKEKWMPAFARPILRDEFGRYQAEDIADPTTYEQAKEASHSRLAQLLEPHGIRLIAITTPKPRFEGQYEAAIEERKVAGQEVQRLKGEMNQLSQDRERLLARVAKEMSIAREKLRGKLDTQRLRALGEELELRADADVYAAQKQSSGQAEESRLRSAASARRASLERAAEGLQAQVAALAERGDIVVREALIESLARTEFSVQASRRDSDRRLREVSH